MGSIARDLRHGLRTLVKTPVLATISVLTFALGIGLTTTMFSIVNGALRDLPLERADRLMHLERNNLSQGIDSMEVTLHDFLDWRQRQHAFQQLAAFYQGTANLSGTEDRPERYDGGFMTANAFDQLGVEPILGRTFVAGEDLPGAEPVVLLGYHVWQSRFHGDPGVVGHTVRLNGRTTTVIGVMPKGFRFPVNQDLWAPLSLDTAGIKRGEGITLEVYGRLKDGVSLDQARADLAAIAVQQAAEHPETNQGVGSVVKPYTREFIGEEAVQVLSVMLGAVFGVLLIACANVANLLLARSVLRTKEVAVRSALGATRRQILRQLLTETFLLAAGGAAGGLALAVAGVALFNRGLVDTEPPYWLDIRIDPTVLLFTLALVLVASLAAGLLPALQASGSKAAEVLKDESRGSSSFRLGRLSRILVVAEIAVSCGLLVGAGLMIKSIVELRTADFGIVQQGVFTARVGLAEAAYPEPAERQRFFDDLLRSLRALPGVESAALADSLPVAGSGRYRFAVEGAAYPTDNDYPRARLGVVTPGYFETLGVAPLAGRLLAEGDRADGLPVAVVNRPFAEHFFPGASPLGRRIRVGTSDSDKPWATVVGVVPDLHMGGSDNENPAGFYLPLAQDDARFMSIVARTQGDPLALTGAVRRAVIDLDPDLPIYFVRTMPEVIRRNTWFVGVFGALFAAFGAAALFLAAIGLYGVMAFSVSRRTQEVGIRLALGARTGQVLGMVFRQGMVQLGIGLLLGLGLAAALSRGIAVLLFQVEPWDPAVFAAIVAILGTSGLAACLLPARRAARVDPVVALRAE
jgi:putative ABC transport system permease protein